MKRAHVCAGMGLLVMLASSSTRAGLFDLSLENRLGGDSNVFRRSQQSPQTGDGTYEIVPRVAVRDENQAIGYAFDYQADYRRYFDAHGRTSNINGVDHVANGKVSWAISPTDRISGTVAYYNGRQILPTTPGATATSIFDPNDRRRTRITDATLAYTHQFSPVLAFSLSGSLDDFDISANSSSLLGQNDSRAYTGQSTLTYELDPITDVGLVLQARRRENRATDPDNDPFNLRTRASSRTDVFDVMISGRRDLSPTLTVSGRIGPSFIRQQQIAAGAIDPRTSAHYAHDESNTVTLFAFADLKKTWKATTLSANYVRSETRSGTLTASSSIADRVFVQARHRVNDRIALSGLVGWDRFDQIFKGQGGSGGFTVNSWRTTGTVEFAIDRNWYLIGQYTYLYQLNGQTGLPAPSTATHNDINAHLGYVGVRYAFETISF